MAKPARVCWDSCNWIAIIKPERNTPKRDGTTEDRFAMCQSVIKRGWKGEVEIIISDLTLKEVRKYPGAGNNQQSSKLPEFLDLPFILMVPVDKYIESQAKSLQTSEKFNLKKNDAIHIATAQRAGVKEFHTFDRGLLRLDGDILDDKGNLITICKPGEGEALGGLFGVEN